jgi:hypothetical protein
VAHKKRILHKIEIAAAPHPPPPPGNGPELHHELPKENWKYKSLDEPAMKIQLNGRLKEQMKSYVYLGHTLTEDGKWDTETRKRICMGKKTIINMKSI